ncbi:MAG: Crp/Fnr family transcriptional regulator [Marinifilaceae bacterium]|jgi:CRP-like cAMP-binding protein|nr:Crp/Fnr family transcriptional regulator [Marinifilaceae bacterium]
MNTLIEYIKKNSTKRIEYKKTILLREGQIADKFIFIEKGIVRHFYVDKEGNDITKNFIIAPAYFMYSISSFISQKAGIVQCESLSPVLLWEISYDKFQEMLAENEFNELWQKVLVDFIVKKERKEISLLRESAKERYLNFMDEFPGLLNKIPHYYIASYLCIKPETLSRVRAKIAD